MFVTVFKFTGVSENAMNFVGCALLMDFFNIFKILLNFHQKLIKIIFNLLRGHKGCSFRAVKHYFRNSNFLPLSKHV